MIEIVQYISHQLNNPTAANRLAQDFIEAAERIALFPYGNPAHVPIRPLKHEYRKVMIKQYLMLYRINEEKKVVTISRIVYAKRDYKRLLE